ncbi:MAG: T9SS type A sorting domain-containing protein [Bacteroidia bacterium]
MQGITDDFLARAWDGATPSVYVEFNGMTSTIPLGRTDDFDPDVALLQRNNCNYGYPYVLVTYLTSDPRIVMLEIYAVIASPGFPVPPNLFLLQSINIANTLPVGTPLLNFSTTVNIDSDQFDKYVIVWDHPDPVLNKAKVYCYTGFMSNNCAFNSQGAIVMPLQSGVTTSLNLPWSISQAYQSDVSVVTVVNNGVQDIEIQYAYIADNGDKVIFQQEKFWDVYNSNLTNLTHSKLIFSDMGLGQGQLASQSLFPNGITYNSPSVAVTRSAGPGTNGQLPNYGYSVVVGSNASNGNGDFNYILGYVYSYDLGLGGEYYQTFSAGVDPLSGTNFVGTTGWPTSATFDYNLTTANINYAPKVTYDRRSFIGNLGNAGYLTIAWNTVDVGCGEQAPVAMYGQVKDGSRVSTTRPEHNDLNIVSDPSLNSGTLQNEWGMSLAGEQGFNLLWAWLEDDAGGTRYAKYKVSPSGGALRTEKDENKVLCLPITQSLVTEGNLQISSNCDQWLAGNYEIFAVNGQRVLAGTFNLQSSTSEIKLGNLTPALYFLRLTNTNQQSHATKFIIH